MTGSPSSRLVVLRGNSGSGKSTTARLLRERLGRGTAWIEQDQIRRILLWEKDHPGAVNIGLIDANVRYALDHGYDVIAEGIMDAGRYGDMLRSLTADHKGLTLHYYFDIPFEETVARHATRNWAHNITADMMRDWYRDHDVLPDIDQTLIAPESAQEDTITRILADLGERLVLSGDRAVPLEG